MSRPIREYAAGHYRNPPEDSDWLRAQLRKHLDREISVNESLADLVQEMPATDYKRMMNRWHVRQHRRKTGYSARFDRANSNGWKQLGRLWRKAIDLGFITEENALTLCWEAESGGFPIWDDAGCRFALQVACFNAAEAAEKNLLRSGVTTKP